MKKIIKPSHLENPEEVRVWTRNRGGGKTTMLARQLQFMTDPHDMEILEEERPQDPSPALPRSGGGGAS